MPLHVNLQIAQNDILKLHLYKTSKKKYIYKPCVTISMHMHLWQKH